MLKYDIVRLANTFIFHIGNQSPVVNEFLSSIKTFKASNSWRIKINKQPDIDFANKIVYLRGNKSSKHLQPVCTWNIPNRLRDKYAAEIREALGEFKEELAVYDTFSLRNCPIFITHRYVPVAKVVDVTIVDV